MRSAFMKYTRQSGWHCFRCFINKTALPCCLSLCVSLCGVYQDSRSEISGVGQGKCTSVDSINLLVLTVCHLIGFNLALELSGST